MNTITAHVDLHPRQQKSVGVDINIAMRVLSQRGLGAHVCGTSTLIWGEGPAVFATLGEVFHRERALDDTEMSVTLWNSHPAPERGRAWLAIDDVEFGQATP
jgi:hypothetical protein